MTLPVRATIRRLSAAAAVIAALGGGTASGQVTAITPTGGLRDLGTTVTSNGAGVDITGGTRRGSNLFHSFGLFSVGPGDVANFMNDTGAATSNILGRATGGVRSEVFGTIQTTGFPGANLILLNPAGWLFGPGSSLNVNGSFHVTTADFVRFGDLNVFCASGCPNGQAEVLSVAEPAAFGFLGPTQPIEVRGAFLQVPEGRTLSIAAGGLTIAEFSFLAAPGGHIQLGSFASAGEATISGLTGPFSALGTMRIEDSFIQATGTRTFDLGGNVVDFDGGSVLLRGGQIQILGSTLDASGAVVDFDENFFPIGTRNGSVAIRGEQLFVSSSDLGLTSAISAFNFGSSQGAPVAIAIDVAGALELAGFTAVQSGTAGTGDAGAIRIAGGSITMDTGAFINSITVGGGRGADVVLEAGTMRLAGAATIGSQSAGFVAPAGAGGDITVLVTDPAGSLTITGVGTSIQSQSTSSEVTGAGGAIALSAPSIFIEDAGIVSTLTASLLAPAGGITINANDLRLIGGGSVQSITLGGPGGDVTVTATATVTIAGEGSGLFSGGALGASGAARAGDIFITARDVMVTDLASIQNGTSLDVAGNITVQALDTITIANGGTILSQAFAENVGDVMLSARRLVLDNGLIQTSTRQAGNAGGVSIDVADLAVVGGGRIVSSTEASGAGGAVSIRAGTASFSGPDSGVFSRAEPDSTGPAGTITMSGGAFRLSDGAQVSVATAGSGAAGDIVFDVGTLEMATGARIDSGTSGVGTGGTVTAVAGTSVSLTGGSELSSSTEGSGRGGTIAIETPQLTLNDASRISVATSGSGAAGDVRLTLGTLTLGTDASIDSGTTGSGAGGLILALASNGVSLTDGTELTSSTAGTGPGGTIVVGTPRLTMTDGSRITVATSGPGAAGDVFLTLGTLDLTAGARIDSGTTGAGAGGAIEAIASEAIAIAGGAALTSTAAGTGPGGTINLGTPRLTVMDGGTISAATSGDGRAGDIALSAGTLDVGTGARIDSGTTGTGAGGTIQAMASGEMTIAGGSVASNAEATGPGGDITLTAGQVSIRSGGTISARSTGTARATAGSITINAGNAFEMLGSRVTTESIQADGGNILIQALEIVRLTDSAITTSVQSGVGAGGNITIDPTFVVLNRSEIRADAFGGPGGNITIVADVFLSAFSIISASSQLSTPGTVDIQARVTDISGTLAQLPSSVLQAAALLQASCATRLAEGRTSSFVVAGREGLPPEPGGILPSPLLAFEARDLASSAPDGTDHGAWPIVRWAMALPGCAR